jgi:hypothetical protein
MLKSGVGQVGEDVPLRRVIIFGILVALLFGMFRLSRLSQDWHYIVPAEDDEILYATSFDGDSMAEWSQDERSAFSTHVTDGVLRITSSINSTLYSLLRPYFDRFDISVQTTIVAGDFGNNNNSFGVIFRMTNPQNYYVFYISGDGYYRVQRVVGNRHRDVSTWHPSDAIQQGVGAVNHLRVIGYGEQFQFYVNDTLLELCIPNDASHTSTIHPLTGECLEGTWQTTLTDSSHAAGQIGVVVFGDDVGTLSDGQEMMVEFDNVIITGGREWVEAIP